MGVEGGQLAVHGDMAPQRDEAAPPAEEEPAAAGDEARRDCIISRVPLPMVRLSRAERPGDMNSEQVARFLAGKLTTGPVAVLERTSNIGRRLIGFDSGERAERGGESPG
jgi:hypothetical protein